jgi:amino acid transporter
MQTQVFSSILRTLGVLLGLGAFGLALVGAMLAGVDPIWALARAVAAFSVLMLAFALLCKIVVPLATALGAPEKAPDSSDGH